MKLSTVFVVLVSVCLHLSISSAQSSLQDIVSHPQCTQSCFFGIEPGATSVSEFLSWLQINNIASESKTLAGGDITIYVLNWMSFSPYIEEGNANVTVIVVGDFIQQVSISVRNITINDVISVFGNPSFIGNSGGVGNDQVIYVANNLIFTPRDTASDEIHLLEILTADALQGSRLDLAPCVGVSSICTIPTATPTNNSTPTAQPAETPTHTLTVTLTPTLSLSVLPARETLTGQGDNSSIAQPRVAANFSKIRGLALHPNGDTLAIGGRYNDQPGIWFYELSTQTITGIPTQGNASALFWRPDGNAIAASVAVGDGMLQVYDVTSGNLLFEFVAQSGRKQIIWSADGSQFIALEVHRVQLRDGNTGNILQTFTYPETNRINLAGIARSEGNQRLYSTFDVERRLLVWDTFSGQILTSYPLPFVSLGPALNSTEDRIALGSNEGDGRVLILNALTGTVLQDFASEGKGFVVLTPLWSPDDTKLAVPAGSTDGNQIGIWAVATGHLLQTVPVNAFTNSQVIVWSSDGESLIFSDGQSFPQTITPPVSNAGSDETASASNNLSAQLTLDGSGSSDSDGTIVSYSWRENGVEIATGVNPQVNLSVGIHTITLIVTDNDGATGIDEVVIQIDPLTPTAILASIPTPTP